MADVSQLFCSEVGKDFVLLKWKIKPGSQLFQNTIVLTFTTDEHAEKGAYQEQKLKSTVTGTVLELLAKEGERVLVGAPLLKFQSCTHQVIMKDLCAQCGEDLRRLDSKNLEKVIASRSFSMVHIVPELKISKEQAEQLDQADEARLLKCKKLVLLVDLDQTIIHTTNTKVPENLKDVYHFQLYNGNSAYHYCTKLRPGTRQFLEIISRFYELHIFTLGARPYAHKIAEILDPDGKYFSHRILSRDECGDLSSKRANLRALFPRGDSMVCIIDDREDLWKYASNVVRVKPYKYFLNTDDINAPQFFWKEHESYRLSQPSSVSCESIVENNQNISDACDSKVQLHSSIDDNSSLNEPKGDEVQVQNDEQKNLCNENENSEQIEHEVQDVKFSETCSKDKASEVSLEAQNNDSATNTELNSSQHTPSDTCPNTNCNMEVEFSNQHHQLQCANVPNDYNSVEFGVADDDDDYLLYLEEILITIHKAYYNMYDQMVEQKSTSIPDLKNVIPYVRKKVLKGVNVVFSGIFPTHELPERSKEWILAESLGAIVSKDLVLDNSEHRTTHVIAAKLGTEKLYKAKKAKNIHIVNINWLECCAIRWERADEQLFPLKKDTPVPFRREKEIFDTAQVEVVQQPKEAEAQSDNSSVYEKEDLATYDPVTGKRIRKAGVQSCQPWKRRKDL